MPRIALSGLSYALPDGRHLFQNLNLTFVSERCGLVGRNGVGKSTLLRLISGEFPPQTGNVIVEGRIGLLRQAVRVAPDERIADLFGVSGALDLLRKAERGKASAEELSNADWTVEARLEESLRSVGLDVEPGALLSELSGGQQTRTELAALMFSEPDFLLLDEPTNNLDRQGREIIATVLSRWRKGMIVVSHDRALLEGMNAIIELTSLGATRYGGGWSFYRERKAIEAAAAENRLAYAESELARLDKAAQARSERQDRRDNGGARKASRGDMPNILAGGLKGKAEASRGVQARLADRQRTHAADVLQTARKDIEILQPLKVAMPSCNLPAGRQVVEVRGLTAGYAPDRPVVHDFHFSMVGPERIALAGANGSGKTTILMTISGAMEPLYGDARILVRYAMLDQDVGILDRALTVAENFKLLNPAASDNDCRAALARFMFRADAALQRVDTLSGGQMLRAGLACVLGGATPPQLLILDEPTNHLDVDSIETVEAGLRSYDGALLVVSHDETFLANIGITRRVKLDGAGWVAQT